MEVSEWVLMSSFRYVLGRQAYIVSEIVENILNNWELLSIRTKDIIKEEIKDGNTRDKMDIDKWVGWYCDKRYCFSGWSNYK